MERVNVVVPAALAAALAMFGVRLWTNASAPEATACPGTLAFYRPAGGLHDRRLPPSRIALYGGRREPPRASQPGGPPPPEERREVRAGSVPGAPAVELSAGVEGRRALFDAARAVGVKVASVSSSEVVDGGMGSRIGAIPSAPAAPNVTSPPVDTNKVHTLEFVDEPKPAEVLLSIPFDGSVDPKVGGGPISADGLVSDNGAVEFPDGAQLSFPAGHNVRGNAGTIAFDIRPDWAGADQTDNSMVQIRQDNVWENTLGIEKNLDSLRFIIIDAVGVERNVNIPIDDWPAGEERQLTATWNRSSMALYVDGQLVGENTLDHPFDVTPTTPIHIGSDFAGSSFAGAGGAIRDFTIYGRALNAQEVAAL